MNLSEPLHRSAQLVRNNKLFAALLTLFTAIAVVVSIVRYQTYLNGFDYSVFTQTLWQYSQFSLPRTSIRDVNLILGDHFHPLLIVLAPLFWIWNNPAVLLGVQPLMFALSAVPLYALAKKHLGRNNALLVSSAYLVSHGLQYALFFEFHEIALAVPLVAVLIYAIDTERYRVVIASSILLCLIKEELFLLVAMAGLVVMVRNKKHTLGAALFVVPVVALGVVTKLLMPALAGQNKYYAYWTYENYGPDAVGLVKNALISPFNFIAKMYADITGNAVKSDTLVVLVLSSGFSVLLSWYALLAVPDLMIRMLSNRGTFYWSYWFHYGAILMPIIFFCLVDVLRKLPPRKHLVTAICTAVLVYNVGLMMNKNFPFAQVINPEFYSLNGDIRAGEQKVHQIVGPSASITAPVTILPHFANRADVYILTDKGRWYTDENVVLVREPATDYVIINTKLPITDVDPSYSYGDLQRDVTDVGYKQIYSDDASGWIVYRK